MKQTNIVLFSIQHCRAHKWYFLFSILLLVLVLYFAAQFYCMIAVYSGGEEDCDRILSGGIDGAGIARVSHCARDLAGLYKKTACESSWVKAIGSVSRTETSGESDLLLLFYGQLDNSSYEGTGKAVASKWEMDRTVVDICRISFQDRKDVEEEKWNSDSWWGYYLGADFSDIPVGTTYVQSVGINQYRVHEVIGILEKGSEFVKPGVLSDGNGNEYDSWERLDNAVIRVTDGKENSGSWAYIPEDGVSLQEAEDYLRKLADEMELQDIQFLKMREAFDYQGKDNRITLQIWKEMLFMVTGCAFLILICVQFLAVLNQGKEIGVLYSMGFLQRDVMGVLFWVNLWKGIAAFGICWVTILGIWLGYADKVNKHDSMLQLLKSKVLPRVLFIDIAFVVLMILISEFFFWKSNPADLTRKRG